jgi:hypothetical protein
VISVEVYTLAGRAVAPCGRGRASDGAEQAIIANATARMTRPTTPLSHVAFARSLLTTAVMSPPPLQSHARRLVAAPRDRHDLRLGSAASLWAERVSATLIRD